MYARIIPLLLLAQTVFAGPWWTGPLLAPAGKTIPAGHFNIEPYFFHTNYPAAFKNVEVLPIVSAGITNFLDVQTSIPYDYSWDKGRYGHGIGDYSLGFGLQLLRQRDSLWKPDVRFVIQEVVPTGRFEDLNPRSLGTDQTGFGAYQTFFGLNFQHTKHFANDHYLRTRLSLSAACPSDVTVHGVNVFGGSRDTVGRVSPGNSYSADLAFEYALTQNWVPVFEALFVDSGASNFTGNPGFTPGGTVATVGGGAGQSASLAPALEYNFTENFGIIGGVWFSVTGPHAAKFTTATLAINYFI